MSEPIGWVNKWEWINEPDQVKIIKRTAKRVVVRVGDVNYDRHCTTEQVFSTRKEALQALCRQRAKELTALESQVIAKEAVIKLLCDKIDADPGI